ncbi:MAG: serine/threonine-protein kinase, partial [Planctomycetota bacterium]
MGECEAERDPVDLVAEEFAQQCRRGAQPSVGEYAERYPALAEQLRALLPSVLMMEELKRHKEADAALPGGAGIEWLGDYRILREIGRGGMGVVFEAEQKTLGRHVALKVLPKHSLLDPKSLQRFQREAQAAAQLHHTNIVPVYGIGEAEGLHYFVMQYIQGQGLNEVLDSFREQRPLPAATGGGAGRRATPVPAPPCGQASSDNLYWRWVAQVGVQVADALNYAHNQGILHRDIKPANIILDTLGTLWITDFGLAKFAHQADLTAPGDILGTLQYMAPEALQSQADARSDVCSLGLTLYELLTLHLPFSDTSPAALLRQISEKEPARPRQINPAIPLDLETVILKAIARHPEQRYQSAAALADDLRRFLDD